MRFEDWDVLLFPAGSKVPMKEFKTSCHLVTDNDFTFPHGSFGLPTMTCFTPSLPPGTPFNISLHHWTLPSFSSYTQTYSSHPHLAQFEATIFIDGRQIASASFSQQTVWPQLLYNTFEFTKNGELEVLKFPSFRDEILNQSYWSPSDDLGRIRIVVSEGFPRSSLTMPTERVKNIVAFSFQHAPLDILENTAIAWPNPGMWQRAPFNQHIPVPTHGHDDGAEAHMHSPRQPRSFKIKPQVPVAVHPQYVNHSILGQIQTQRATAWRPSFDWTNASLDLGKSTSSDASMQDYHQKFTGNGLMRDALFPDLMAPSNTPVGQNEAQVQQLIAEVTKDSGSASCSADDENHESSQRARARMAAATTDPKVSGLQNDLPASMGAGFPLDLAESLTQSLLSQPPPLLATHTVYSDEDKENGGAKVRSSTPAAGKMSVKFGHESTNGPVSMIDEHQSHRFDSHPPLFEDHLKLSEEESASSEEDGSPPNEVSCASKSVGKGCLHGGILEKGRKRPRNFTSASSKVIDEEDEPRRVSPKLRVGFGDNLLA